MPYCRSARTSRFLRLLVAIAALTRGLSSSASHASELPRVVVVMAGEPSATGERVRAELATMGFAIVLDDEGKAEPTRDALAAVAQARDAVAAVALTLSPEGLELWVVAGHETRLRSFVSTEHAAADATTALRAAELLRATLLAFTAAPPAADATPPEPQGRASEGTPEPPLKAPLASSTVGDALTPALSSDPESSRWLTLRLGPGFVTSVGGLGTFPSLDLAARCWLGTRIGVELAALVPLARMSERSSEGSSATRVGALSLGIVSSVPVGTGDWVWDIGAGVAAVALQTGGTPASVAYTREENVAVAAAPLLRSGISYALTRRLRLGFGASLGVSMPRFLIVHAGRTAATWGRPFASGGLALEVDVP